MLIFVERFILPLLVACIATFVLVNVYKWDWQQRGSFFVALFCFAYFVAYSVTKPTPPAPPITSAPVEPMPPREPAKQQPPIVNQNSSGNGSPNVQGTQGDVKIEIDQSTGKTIETGPTKKKSGQIDQRK
jgi:hypothetical protein